MCFTQVQTIVSMFATSYEAGMFCKSERILVQRPRPPHHARAILLQLIRHVATRREQQVFDDALRGFSSYRGVSRYPLRTKTPAFLAISESGCGGQEENSKATTYQAFSATSPSAHGTASSSADSSPRSRPPRCHYPTPLSPSPSPDPAQVLVH